MTDMTREVAIERLNRCREVLEFSSHMDNQNREAFDMAISDMKCVEDLYGYVDDAIEAEKRMMGRILDLASVEYHKGIIYALERMKMKLME